MKDELGTKVMKKKISELNAKNYIWFTGYENEKRKAKGTSKCVIKIKNKFEDCKNCWDTAQLENKTNHLEKIIMMRAFIKNSKKLKKLIRFLLKKLIRLL